MKDLWLKFGCFLTGYNYTIIQNTSEASKKAVKKYISALLIVSTLWGFVGFAFTQRYLHGSFWISIMGAVIMVVLVIQIERQIILSIVKNSFAINFRMSIGIVMAIIGSVILDQIIFKEDIEKKKIGNIETEVNNILPIKTAELSQQIEQLENSVANKERERADVINEISKNPMISVPSTKFEFEKDSLTGKMLPTKQTITNNSIPNPKTDLISQIDAQIKLLREQKTIKENVKLNIQQLLENELKSKVGFLDELKLLFSILFSSIISLIIWILLFIFFLAIELFVLVNKIGDKNNDYDKIILHQMNTKIKMLDNLS